MDKATQTVQAILRQQQFEQKVVTALRAVSAMENADATMDEDWFAQTVRGFINVVLEAAQGTEKRTRDMFFATIVPGILAEGPSPALLLRSSTTFLNLLGSQLSVEAPASDQPEVTKWMARFAGSYIEDLYQACLVAQEP